MKAISCFHSPAHVPEGAHAPRGVRRAAIVQRRSTQIGVRARELPRRHAAQVERGLIWDKVVAACRGIHTKCPRLECAAPVQRAVGVRMPTEVGTLVCEDVVQVEEEPLYSEVIRGTQRSSEVLRGHQRQRVVHRGLERSSGNQRPSEANQRPPEATRGQQRHACTPGLTRRR